MADPSVKEKHMLWLQNIEREIASIRLEPSPITLPINTSAVPLTPGSTPSKRASKSVTSPSSIDSSGASSRISGSGFIFYEPKAEHTKPSRKSTESLRKMFEQELTFRPSVGRGPLVSRPSFDAPKSCSCGIACKRCSVAGHSFRPRLSLATEEIMANSSVPSRHEKLYEDRLDYEVKRVKAAQQRFREEDSNCSFKPAIDSSSESVRIVRKLTAEFGGVDAYLNNKRMLTMTNISKEIMKKNITPTVFVASPAPRVPPVDPSPGLEQFLKRISIAQQLKQPKPTKQPSSTHVPNLVKKADQDLKTLCFGPFPESPKSPQELNDFLLT